MEEKINVLDVDFVQSAIANALSGSSKLPREISNELEGMSTPAIRHLLNNLCSFDGCKYLEIGTYKGSTLISAMYGNDVDAVGCDDWSEFNGPADAFQANVQKYIRNGKLKFYAKNCFDIFDLPSSHFNVYLYDGGHHTKQQKMAITCFAEHCTDQFVLCVDDWNWDTVKNGTRQGIEKEGLTVVKEWELTNQHNGFFVALVRKNSACNK